MKADALLTLLIQANQLKLVPRTGWVMRGVTDAESVSDHSFGTAFIALILAQEIEEPIDVAKLLTLALLHDLPEAVLGDIPAPASRYLPAARKLDAERSVLVDLLGGLEMEEQWMAWWMEYREGESIEGKLVRDADRLDMLLQAYIYEQTTGNRLLKEFWLSISEDAFACDVARSVFDALRDARRCDEECK